MIDPIFYDMDAIASGLNVDANGLYMNNSKATGDTTPYFGAIKTESGKYRAAFSITKDICDTVYNHPKIQDGKRQGKIPEGFAKWNDKHCNSVGDAGHYDDVRDAAYAAQSMRFSEDRIERIVDYICKRYDVSLMNVNQVEDIPIWEHEAVAFEGYDPTNKCYKFSRQLVDKANAEKLARKALAEKNKVRADNIKRMFEKATKYVETKKLSVPVDMSFVEKYTKFINGHLKEKELLK